MWSIKADKSWFTKDVYEWQICSEAGSKKDVQQIEGDVIWIGLQMINAIERIFLNVAREEYRTILASGSEIQENVITCHSIWFNDHSSGVPDYPLPAYNCIPV